jgi:hypothetical protein
MKRLLSRMAKSSVSSTPDAAPFLYDAARRPDSTRIQSPLSYSADAEVSFARHSGEF